MTPAPQVEKPEAQPNAPPSAQEGNQAETDSAPANRERVGTEKTSTDVEGEAQNQEEPASPAINVELGEEVLEIPEETTSSPDESEPVQTRAQEESTQTGSDLVTQGDNSIGEDAQVEASESVVQENVVQEKVDEVPGGNAGLEDNVSTNESGNAESLESQENLEVQETSNNEASETGKADVDLQETIPADESEIGADDPLESQENENLGVQEAPNDEAPGNGNLDADLEETIPADSSEIDDEPLESVEEVEEGGPPEISTSLGFTGISGEDATFDVGVGFVQNNFGVETIIKTPVGGGEEAETAVDVETVLPLSETTSVSLKAEDLLSDGSTITASADVQVLPNLIVSPGIEKSSDEALKTNLSAALQATETLALAFDIENIAAEPVFNIESNLALGEHEVIARIKDVSAVEARTFDLEGSFQIVEGARARVKLESIFNSPVVGFGTDIQLTRSTELNVGVNDAFGSQTYDAKIKYTFGL